MYICIKSDETEMVLEVSRLLCNDEEIVVAFRGGGTLRIENIDSDIIKTKALYNKYDKIDTAEFGGVIIDICTHPEHFFDILKIALMEG